MCMILFTFVLYGVWFLLSTFYFENANYLVKGGWWQYGRAVLNTSLSGFINLLINTYHFRQSFKIVIIVLYLLTILYVQQKVSPIDI